jgi:putative MATE family efflux protein
LNERVVSNASLLALVLGTLVSVSLVKFCDPLLTLAGTSPALLEAARPYLLIRAVGIPFVFLATVLQGGSLGRGNAWRPLKIFGAAGVVNLIGDVWLTLMKGWGATGAATATVAAQIAAAVYYVITSARLEKGVEASSEKLRDVALVWRGLPSNHVVKTFMNVAVALFSRSIGLMLAYSMLTRTAALGGTLALAAHQVTLQVWWLLSFLPEPMSVAAQTLITRDMKDRKHRVPNLIKTLYGMSATLGVSAAALTFAVLRNSHVTSALVADVSVQKMIATMVPFAALSQAYCPIATISDGVCIGLSSFSQLPTIMLGSFATTAVGLSIVASQGLGVVGVWACMNVFLSSRILGHSILSKKLRKYLQLAFKKNASTRGSVMPAPVAA